MLSSLENRPLSPEELAGLPRPAPWFGVRALPAALLRFVLYFLVVWLALAVAGGLVDAFLRSRLSGLDLPEWVAWFVAFVVWGLAVAIPARMAWRAWKRSTHGERMRQRDLHEARAQVMTLHDADFVALPGLLEGSFYLYAVDDGRSLLLDGPRAARCAQSRPGWLRAPAPLTLQGQRAVLRPIATTAPIHLCIGLPRAALSPTAV